MDGLLLIRIEKDIRDVQLLLKELRNIPRYANQINIPDIY